VIPEMPTLPVSPKPTASPCAAAVAVNSPAVRPASPQPVRVVASISTALRSRPDDDGGAGVGAARHHGPDRVVVGVAGLDHPAGDAGAQVGDGGGRVGGGPGGVDRGGLVGGGPGHAAFLLVGGVMHLAMHGSTAGTSETDRG